MLKVYLAGPITGMTYDGSESWRRVAKSFLEPEIKAYSPMRQQDFLRNVGVLTANGPALDSTTTDDGIMVRDHFDVMTSDLVLVNLLGAMERVSIGTVMELGFAYAHRKPVVLMIEDTDNIHDHGMVRKAGVFRASTLEEGLRLTKSILLSE